MIKHYPFSTLGKADHGWLKANHHFSFARYYNPQRMGFGVLRVINDDFIAANQGFPAHPHNNMEIITFVRSGAITHQDSEGNKGITKAGEVQVMSAGAGIVHSEYNLEKEPTTLYQIWIETNQKNVKPRWETRRFDNQAASSVNGNNSVSQLPLLVSGFEQDKDQALFIHQNARIFAGQLKAGQQARQAINHQAYVLASKGTFELIDEKNRYTLDKGDGAEVTNSSMVTIKALTDTEVVVIDLPKLAG